MKAAVSFQKEQISPERVRVKGGRSLWEAARRQADPVSSDLCQAPLSACRLATPPGIFLAAYFPQRGAGCLA